MNVCDISGGTNKLRDGGCCEDKKMCIPISFICDNVQDCIDGSDENKCANKTSEYFLFL